MTPPGPRLQTTALPLSLRTLYALLSGLSLAALLVALGHPSHLISVAALVLAIAALLTLLRGRRQLGRRVVRALLALSLAVTSGIALHLATVASGPEDRWQTQAGRHLDRAVAQATAAIVELEAAARQRALEALAPGADLLGMARPLELAGAALPVGVSLWRGGALLDWAGEVPGPQRPPGSSQSLLVDHGFRRYLTVSSEDPQTPPADVRAFVDVSLGITRELFLRLGVGEEPGRPLSAWTGLEVDILVEAPGSQALGDTSQRVVGIPQQSPWVWLSVRAPTPGQERRGALRRVGRLTSWGVLICVGLGLLLLLRRWPWSRRGGAWVALATAAVLLAGRVAIDRAGVLSLAFDNGATGSLRLLLEPAYFATTLGFGLLRSVLDFLATSLVLAATAVLLLPAWLSLVRGNGRRGSVSLGGALLLVSSAGTLVWCRFLQETVAQNANPKLIGLDAPFFTVPFLVLHLALVLALAAPALWVLVGWASWLRQRGGRSALIAAAVASVLLAATALLTGRTVALAFWSGAVPWVALGMAPSVWGRPFALRLVAALLMAVWLAGIQAEGLGLAYGGLKEIAAYEQAEEQLNPGDNWRLFLLEDLLSEFASDPDLLVRLTDPAEDRSNAAFELWASSSLSALGSGAHIELLAPGSVVLSDFDLGLPYEPPPMERWRLESVDTEDGFDVETVELVTEQGPFLVYRGRLHLESLAPEGDAEWLVIDLPYAAQDPSAPMDLSGRGPLPLGFRARRELAPRREFEKPVVIGRVDSGVVVASSDPALVGLSLASVPPGGTWSTVSLGGVPHRVSLVSSDDAPQDQAMVVAFPQSTLPERLLDVSRLTAIYIWSGVLLVGVAVLIFSLRHGRAAWPASLGRLGFGERLLGALVLVVLLPVILSGVFQQRRVVERLERANLEEVARRLDTAVRLLGSTLDDTAYAVIGSEYLQDILDFGNTVAPRQVGPFERSQAMVFTEAGELLLDETLSDLTPEEARDFLELVSGGELVLQDDVSGWYLGRLYPEVRPDGSAYPVFVRRLLTDEDLGRLARTVGANLTLYDGPWAVVSSQDDLYKSGLLVPILASVPRRLVLEGGSRRYVQSDPRDGLVVATGYAPVAGVGQSRRGVLAANLFARATQAAMERQRAQLFLLGLSSLAFVSALAAGLGLSQRIVHPIRRLVEATRRVGRGDLTMRLRGGGKDEIGELVGSFNSMTQQIQTSQQSLAARRSFLEAMLGHLSAGVLVVDGQGQVQESNRAAQQLLGERLQAMVEQVTERAQAEAVLATEVTLTQATGPRTLRLVITPIQLEAGAPGYLALFDDVTELLASRRLALYAEMARQVAHEVKNPLTPIQLAAQMVRQACEDRHPRLDEIVADNVQQIEGQVQRLRDIASEFSLLGREAPLELEAIPVRKLLDEVRDLYPYPDGHQRVTAQGAEEIEALGSREALIKVLTNLVENALQAMGGHGAVHLAVRQDDEIVTVEVADEGPGIPGQVEERLFEPYFSTKSTGTGLGLIICRNLVEKMGGSIRLGNRSDAQGAVAHLELPSVSPAETPSRAPGREAPGS